MWGRCYLWLLLTLALLLHLPWFVVCVSTFAPKVGVLIWRKGRTKTNPHPLNTQHNTPHYTKPHQRLVTLITLTPHLTTRLRTLTKVAHYGNGSSSTKSWPSQSHDVCQG